MHDDIDMHDYKGKKRKKRAGGEGSRVIHVLVTSIWPLTPKIDTATWAFFGLSDMRHGLLKDSDMGHDYFLKSTG